MERAMIDQPRALDELGRVVVPIEVRALLGLSATGRQRLAFYAARDGRVYIDKEPEERPAAPPNDEQEKPY